MNNALELALEALNSVDDEGFTVFADMALINKAIAALKEAIKQQGEPVGWMLRRELWAKYNGYRRFADSRSDGLWDVAVFAQAPTIPTIPAGWQLVPIEPTDEMGRAFHNRIANASFQSAYADMLSAAPKGETK